MSKMMKVLMAATALAVVASPAVRADEKDDGSTSVQLSAEARRTVTQDRALATLNFEATGKTAEEVQRSINTKMQDAKKLYDAVTDIKVSTGQYNVYKDYRDLPEPKKGETIDREKYAIWRGSQEVRLDGAKKQELLDLISTLQKQGFAATGLNFYLSQNAQDQLKDELIVEALGNIQERAKNIQKALGMKTIRYARIDLNDQGGRPVPMMARAYAKGGAEMADASMPAPVAEEGETDVVVGVTAEVKLK